MLLYLIKAVSYLYTFFSLQIIDWSKLFSKRITREIFEDGGFDNQLKSDQYRAP